MNIKFLDKVYDQILSETRIDDNDKVYDQILSETRIDDNDLNGVLGKGLIYFPFLLLGPLLLHENKENFFFPLINQRFYIHCKEVYGLNKEETEYVWGKYKEGIVLLMEKKELSYEY
jgi:hypothetical protein